MELVAMSWLDRNWCLFVVSTCGIGEGEEINCRCLHQLDNSGQAALDMVIINVPQPKVIAIYYKGAGSINLHNRIRADKLRMDCNLATKYWDKRINLSILSIVGIDAYLFFQQAFHADNRTSCPTEQVASNSSEGCSLTNSLIIRRVFG
jgi:hypothetical protein